MVFVDGLALQTRPPAQPRGGFFFCLSETGKVINR